MIKDLGELKYNDFLIIKGSLLMVRSKSVFDHGNSVKDGYNYLVQKPGSYTCFL